MATLSRQPFAPLDGARLQNLGSLKNRQNALPQASGAKRKAADVVENDDSENIDPSLFSKRSKASSISYPAKDLLKPTAYILKASTPLNQSSTFRSSTKATPLASTRARALLQPKSPAAKLNTAIAKSSPFSAPAGRSPTRSKRSGILSSRRRTAGPYTRVDPPLFNLSAAAPFSLDAALKGTIPSYAARSPISAQSLTTPVVVSPRATVTKDILEPDMKASWFFDIHEDTPEQEMTNMLQHGTCVLDISSDEESEVKATRERAEGRDKENVPPADDVSQTTARQSRSQEDDMVIEKQRTALGEMDAAAFYALGCDESSVIFVPADDEQEASVRGPSTFELSTEPKVESTQPVVEISNEVDELMEKTGTLAAKAAVLQPVEGTGESFEVWESDSTKGDDVEAATTGN
ncbi:hypothetical protein VDGD_04978 [Verticillium dahliae]|nr:hypothetical protein VDGD_04978 [Verticillium dahliae]